MHLKRRTTPEDLSNFSKESVIVDDGANTTETKRSIKIGRRSEEEIRAIVAERKLKDAYKSRKNDREKIKELEEKVQDLSTEHKNNFTEMAGPLNYLEGRDNKHYPKPLKSNYNKINYFHGIHPSYMQRGDYNSYDEKSVYGIPWYDDEDIWPGNPYPNEFPYHHSPYSNETYNRPSGGYQHKSKPTYESIAKELLGSTSFFQYNNYLFLYTGKSYKLVETDERFRLEARRLLADNKKYEVLKSHLNEVKEMILTDIPRISNDEMERYTHYIAFENCIYDAKRNKSLPHSPDYLTIGFIKANYYEDLHLENPPKLFINYLKSVTKGDQLEVKRLCEAFAYWLSNYNKIRCYFVLFGVSQS
ncbi:MAG: hypothetical protein E7234_01425, partial [Lachnospiraceae bacterium]|nr:hypothetical protein [Lachnospiraceae bacterium]